MELKEIAERIDKHLRKLEADPEWNKSDQKYHTKKFFMAGARVSGRYVTITYVSYQGNSRLTREEAGIYLSWLDAGNKGKHHEAIDWGKRGKDENIVCMSEPHYREKICTGDGRTYYPDLTEKFYAMLMALAPAVKVDRKSKYDKHFIPRNHIPCGMMPTFHIVEPAAREAIEEFFVQMQSAFEQSYQAGLAHGRDLLGQLARAEITVGDFDKVGQREDRA